MKSIRYLTSKIKLTTSFLNKTDTFIILIIILTSSASFGLGRLSKIEEGKTPLYVGNNTQNIALVAENNGPEAIKGKYVASVSGSKYHLPWCSGAQTISEKNKIWFNSKEEAESRGYQPAKNCKGI